MNNLLYGVLFRSELSSFGFNVVKLEIYSCQLTKSKVHFD